MECGREGGSMHENAQSVPGVGKMAGKAEIRVTRRWEALFLVMVGGRWWARTRIGYGWGIGMQFGVSVVCQ